MRTKSPFIFVFSCCDFTDVILWSKSWCEMFVIKLSGIKSFMLTETAWNMKQPMISQCLRPWCNSHKLPFYRTNERKYFYYHYHYIRSIILKNQYNFSHLLLYNLIKYVKVILTPSLFIDFNRLLNTTFKMCLWPLYYHF